MSDGRAAYHSRCGVIESLVGDIVRMDTDAIVNAANTSLLGGGGVDGAIHRAAGPELEFACRMLNGCKVGEAKITKGFRLAARFIIHTVGPVWRGGRAGEDEALASCYRSSIELAQKHGVASLAFPAVSTGIYGFPPERAALIAVRSVKRFAEGGAGSVRRVVFCSFTAEARKHMLAALSAEAVPYSSAGDPV